MFAFLPPLMISSVSFVKEPLFIYSYVNLIKCFYNREYSKSIPYLLLAILIRPYSPFLFILTYLYLFNRAKT